MSEEKLERTFPPGIHLNVVGPVKSGKTIFLRECMAQCLREGMKTVVVSMDMRENTFREFLQDAGVEGDLEFIDCHKNSKWLTRDYDAEGVDVLLVDSYLSNPDHQDLPHIVSTAMVLCSQEARNGYYQHQKFTSPIPGETIRIVQGTREIARWNRGVLETSCNQPLLREFLAKALNNIREKFGEPAAAGD